MATPGQKKCQQSEQTMQAGWQQEEMDELGQDHGGDSIVLSDCIASRLISEHQQRAPAMNAKLSPMVSEFETDEQAASYDRWFRAKVDAGLNSTKPLLTHDQAMDRLDAQLTERRIARAKNSLD